MIRTSMKTTFAFALLLAPGLIFAGKGKKNNNNSESKFIKEKREELKNLKKTAKKIKKQSKKKNKKLKKLKKEKEKFTADLESTKNALKKAEILAGPQQPGFISKTTTATVNVTKKIAQKVKDTGSWANENRGKAALATVATGAVVYIAKEYGHLAKEKFDQLHESLTKANEEIDTDAEFLQGTEQE